MKKRALLWTLGLVLIVAQFSAAEAVRFRHELADADGNTINSVRVGDEFFLRTYTQHADNFVSDKVAGVFAAFLDIGYDEQLAQVTGDVIYGPNYQNFMEGNLATPGLMDNVGAVASVNMGLDPIGFEEQLVFSVPMRATQAGTIGFVGFESNSYPMHEILVYGFDDPIPPGEVDFGSTFLVVAVPEPNRALPLLSGVVVLLISGPLRRAGGHP